MYNNCYSLARVWAACDTYSIGFVVGVLQATSILKPKIQLC